MRFNVRLQYYIAIWQQQKFVGHVTNAQTHESVRRAIIRISTSKQQWDEFTYAEGRFKFPFLVRGEYNLFAHRDGFTNRSFKVELSDFDDGKDLSIELRPQGLITGKVVDGSGQPLERTTTRMDPPSIGDLPRCVAADILIISRVLNPKFESILGRIIF